MHDISLFFNFPSNLSLFALPSYDKSTCGNKSCHLLPENRILIIHVANEIQKFKKNES